MNARVAQHNSATRAVRICGHDARLEPENSCGLYLHVLGPFVGPESPIQHATTATWRDLIGFDQIVTGHSGGEKWVTFRLKTLSIQWG
jgi:hypothetical protein